MPTQYTNSAKYFQSAHYNSIYTTYQMRIRNAWYARLRDQNTYSIAAYRTYVFRLHCALRNAYSRSPPNIHIRQTYSECAIQSSPYYALNTQKCARPRIRMAYMRKVLRLHCAMRLQDERFTKELTYAHCQIYLMCALEPYLYYALNAQPNHATKCTAHVSSECTLRRTHQEYKTSRVHNSKNLSNLTSLREL